MKTYTKICDVCDREFTSKRSHAISCSKQCRMKAHRISYIVKIRPPKGRLCDCCEEQYTGANYFKCTSCHTAISRIYDDMAAGW